MTRPPYHPKRIPYEGSGKGSGKRGHRSINAAFHAYKVVLSPMLHALSFSRGGCRFQPSCSEYAALACAQHGLARGGAMALWRLMRCNPFTQGGWDPVPPVPTRGTAV